MSRTLDRVVEKLRAREGLGLEKYGTTVDRTDLSALEWLDHAQEEAMDFTLYLERLKDKLRGDQ